MRGPSPMLKNRCHVAFNFGVATAMPGANRCNRWKLREIDDGQWCFVWLGGMMLSLHDLWIMKNYIYIYIALLMFRVIVWIYQQKTMQFRFRHILVKACENSRTWGYTFRWKKSNNVYKLWGDCSVRCPQTNPPPKKKMHLNFKCFCFRLVGGLIRFFWGWVVV